MRTRSSDNTFKNFTRKPMAAVVFAALFGTLPLYAAPAATDSSSINNRQDKKSSPPEQNLDAVTVEGKKPVGQISGGKDGVYDDNLSSTFKDKQDIDTFRGTSAADVLQGMVGVYSGDARNSGAIDPNVRGIQGQGRVPVTVDGTEQAITVYRGYAGANNRNYIDPLLISSIRVEKGPSLTRGLENSVGGGIAIKTIGVEDVVKPGQTFGLDIRIEGANNATGDHVPNIGKWYGKTEKSYGDWARPYMSTRPYSWDPTKNDQSEFDKTGNVNYKYYDLVTGIKRSRQSFNSFGHDQAYRIAGGMRTDKVDLIAAFAYRNRGNYFAGKGGFERYKKIGFRHAVTKLFRGGDEVTNTSSATKSFLLKGTLRPTEDQAIGLGWHHIVADYGDILPSRIQHHSWSDGVNNFEDLYTGDSSKVPQWPLSHIKLDTYNLEYSFNPMGNKWLDFKANLWATRARSDTQNSGGYVLESVNNILTNTALYRSSNNRWGVNASNRIRLMDTLSLTFGGSYQSERMVSRDGDEWKTARWGKDGKSPGNIMNVPRQGQRDEYKFDVNFDWQPTERLVISAGARYNSYGVTDESWQELVGQIPSLEKLAEADKKKDELPYNAFYYVRHHLAKPSGVYLPYVDKNGKNRAYKLYYDQQGKLNRKDNPFFNGMAEKEGWQVPDNQKGSPTHVFVLKPIYGMFYQYSSIYNGMNPDYMDWYDGGMVGDMPNPQLTDEQRKERMLALENSGWREQALKKGKAHSWSPVLSIAYNLTESSRIYARWAQATRMPSVFESTIGFSGSLSSKDLITGKEFKPEKATNIEVGYVQDVTKWLPGNPEKADIKLAWYRNHVKNAFDRSNIMFFSQRDQWKTSGLELQARYDNGRFYTQLGANYVMQNKVCDEGEAVSHDVYFGKVPNCINGGFPTSYMSNMDLPKYSFDWELGGRFFERKLETGARLHWHSSHRQTDGKGIVSDWDYFRFNQPLSWQPVLTVDAYLRYTLKNNFSAELTATNLTNRYYLDPLARSPMPAPGRTIRLSLSKKF